MMNESMYETCSSGSTLVDDCRRRMTLDFAAPQRKCFRTATTSAHIDGSKVASPDLEAFLLYASAGGGSELECGADNASSTPTQILFPKSVTAEQEAYARGFVDALEELHRRQGVPAVAGPAQSVVSTQSSTSSSADNVAASRRTSDVSHQPQTSSSHASSVSSPGSSVGGPGDVMLSLVHVDGRYRLTTMDDGVQTVPRLSCLTPPSSPDVDAVQLVRVDRKRERNRLAAQKCRSRKLEQIAVLESRCAVLRDENSVLSRTAKQLAEQVSRLRHSLAEHTAGSQCVINSTYTSNSPSTL